MGRSYGILKHWLVLSVHAECQREERRVEWHLETDRQGHWFGVPKVAFVRIGRVLDVGETT